MRLRTTVLICTFMLSAGLAVAGNQPNATQASHRSAATAKAPVTATAKAAPEFRAVTNAPAPVPALDARGLIALAALLGAVGFAATRR